MGEAGVSTMVATLVLIIITIGIGGLVLPAIVTEIAEPENPPLRASLVLSLSLGEKKLTVIHDHGDFIWYAFRLKNGEIRWLNLEVRINGVVENVASGATLNGENTVDPVHFSPGDVLVFPVDLSPGDWVAVVHTTRDQILVDMEIPSS